MITVSINVIFLMMKKQILNLGKALNKAEQKSISGGGNKCLVYPSWSGQYCSSDQNCETELPYEIGRCINGCCIIF